MVEIDAGLIVAAIIVPVVLLAANLVMLAKYIDPQHAAGHYTAKFILVGSALSPHLRTSLAGLTRRRTHTHTRLHGAVFGRAA